MQSKKHNNFISQFVSYRIVKISNIGLVQRPISTFFFFKSANFRCTALISAFVVLCLNSVMSVVSVTKIASLMLASVAEQASLSLTGSVTPEDTFSHDEAHFK